VSEPIKHKGCGGDVVSEELIFTGYEIVSDGAGGWDTVIDGNEIGGKV